VSYPSKLQKAEEAKDRLRHIVIRLEKLDRRLKSANQLSIEAVREVERRKAIFNLAEKAAKLDKLNARKARKELKHLENRHDKTAARVLRDSRMLKFAKLQSLGLKPGVCCKQANSGPNKSCLTCKCDATVSVSVKDRNAHCLTCRPDHIHLKDVNGMGTCREWKRWKNVKSTRGKTKTQCPLFPGSISKVQNPKIGFAGYRWGWFKPRISPPQNKIKSKVTVIPLCQGMKKVSCSAVQKIQGKKPSRSCATTKAVTCDEVWVHPNSLVSYFKRLAKIVAAKAKKAREAAKAAAAVKTPKAPVITLLEERSHQVEPTGTQKDQEDARRARRLRADRVRRKTNDYVGAKCKALGGKTRVVHDRIFCAVPCNPESTDLRAMLGLPGTKWKTNWKAGDWCAGVAAML